MSSPVPRLVALAALAGGVLASRGLPAPAAPAVPVEVSAVKFSNLRAPSGSPGNWYEADVALNVRPAHGAPAQMVSRVKIILLLAFDLPGTLGGNGGSSITGPRRNALLWSRGGRMSVSICRRRS
ncbi:MAG: hypothetical protein ACKOE8_16625 [Opitutaceae bacterium]